MNVRVELWKPMSRMRQGQAAHYLTLLITGAVLVVAMTTATQSVPAAGGSDVPAIVQAAPNPVRGRHNGKIVFTKNNTE